MRTNRLALLAVPAIAAALTVACSTEEVATGTDIGEAIERNAKIVDTIGPNAIVEGQFDPRVRAYGYVVPLKAGAKISVSLEATGGSDARRDDLDAPLDTQLAVNAPYASKTARGARIVASEDGPNGEVPAPPVSFQADRDQNYLVTFMSNEDTGEGSYKLTLTCEGTDFQCQRANFDKPCTPGQLFVQGAKIEGNAKWDQCEVVILESATVTEGSTLTIQPGVTVKGNYIDPQNPGSGFGTVSLTVEGLLQAAGTKEAPVAFTSFKEDRGWGGIVIKSKGNSMKNVVRRRASASTSPAAARVVTLAIEGVTMQGQRRAGIRAQEDIGRPSPARS